MEYYYEAIEIVRQQAPGCTIIVFSDDPVWVTGNTSFKNIVIGPTGAEDIYLMSLCKGAIIANSSFSWWSAWLQAPNNIVVAPDPWGVGRGDNVKDVVPDRWHKIPCKYI